jgi:small subunit ribosomal protein S17
VHDPRSSLRLGDVIAIEPGWRVSKHVHHVVSRIIAPFGDPIEARPAVPTREEREAERAKKKAEKDARRAERRAATTASPASGDESGGEGQSSKEGVKDVA